MCQQLFPGVNFVFSTEIRKADRAWLFQIGGCDAGRQKNDAFFSLAANSAESPVLQRLLL
jgi:hypothetical protein